ncbi:hypothetical protein [Paludifilum halophilum]|uniref:WYL domain-containing protein n=1 Tax=Paludifilum halophilum TaxID=1642702 RepID=A0A235BAZ2_9BACL|nr:hypothetical protein [Paludifilum halophilum]OYD09463.1 hypothetical protein CHM34_00090 [Paludifilum halophilum]
MVDQVLKRGWRRGEVTQIIYLDRQGRMTQRRIRIYTLNGEEVEAYCCERRAFRRFKRQGILAAMKEERRSGPWQ